MSKTPYRHGVRKHYSVPEGEQADATNGRASSLPVIVDIIVVAQDLISPTASSRPGTLRIRHHVSRTGRLARAR
ncbi:uncharacterized protein CCOS01_03668 [Colletotrichum costaricense]|uniref:Uncharacterized protein n=1 Tax=Colletotrichum costaricense TaxID=1209916 RepID=A0AAI9Z718_9PEZI|nr:uncharacterized protein CCOS01_03668 [Colletotrichum costaricense]KAK1534916.1 hypothetical protein CCOS01_03668 [Colletotrichum costaricense]